MWGVFLGILLNVSWGSEPVLQLDFKGEGPSVMVKAIGVDAVALPACRGVVWERFEPDRGDGGEYEVLPMKPCGSMTPAIWVDAGGLEFVAPDELGLVPGDAVRVNVVAGLECAQGVPFEIANCARLEQLVVRGMVQ